MADLAFSKRYLLALVFLILLLNCFVDHLKSEALVLEEEFAGEIVMDLKVNLPAGEVWAVYRLHDFQTILMKLNPGSIKQIDYINGDGGVGSFVNLTTQPGSNIISLQTSCMHLEHSYTNDIFQLLSEIGGAYYVDEIIAIDDITMTRIMRTVEGEHVDLGFTLVQSNSRIIQNEKTSCIVRTTMSFKLKQDSLESMSKALLLRANWLPANIVVDYVNSLRSTPLVLRKEFKAEIVTEMKVNLPANEIWDVFRSKDFGHLLLKLSPGYFKQIEYIKGDGGMGTILNIMLQPEYGSSNWLDEVIKIEDSSKTILFQRISGGVLNSGFTEFASGYKIIKKVYKSCVVRAFTPFKVKAESISTASTLTPNWDTAMAVANYVNSVKI